MAHVKRVRALRMGVFLRLVVKVQQKNEQWPNYKAQIRNSSFVLLLRRMDKFECSKYEVPNHKLLRRKVYPRCSEGLLAMRLCSDDIGDFHKPAGVVAFGFG